MIVLSNDASHEILGNGQKGFAKDFGVRFLRGPDEQQRLMGMIIMRAILSYAFMREQQIQNVKAMLEPTLQVTASKVYFEVIFYIIRATEEENRVITISYERSITPCYSCQLGRWVSTNTSQNCSLKF